jgi:ubiquinone/menaquinone biosynthesis C-methylase UbiE
MQQNEPAVVTAGHTINWARYYDLLVSMLTLGRSGSMRERTVELAEITAGEDVLDVGCGTGDLTMVAGKRSGAAGRVHGIDAAPEMIAVARRKAARLGLKIDYSVAAAEDLPFADSSFDVVLSSLVMHHLPDDLKRTALAEIRRVLRPGGRLLVIDLKRSSGRSNHLSPVLLLHRHMSHGVQDLPQVLEDAGFTSVESGEAVFGWLGFARGRVKE